MWRFVGKTVSTTTASNRESGYSGTIRRDGKSATRFEVQVMFGFLPANPMATPSASSVDPFVLFPTGEQMEAYYAALTPELQNEVVMCCSLRTEDGEIVDGDEFVAGEDWEDWEDEDEFDYLDTLDDWN